MGAVSNNDVKLDVINEKKQHTDLSFEKEGQCSRRSGLERLLLFVVVVVCMAVIGLTVALVLVSKEEKVVSVPEVCNTPDCAQAAARVLDSIDDSVDPCDDFYMYACGSWKKKNVIPEDRSSYNTFGILRENVQVVNRYLLEDDKLYEKVESIQKAKDLYASCVDLETIEAMNLTVAIPLLEELDGWPVLGNNPGGNWNSDNFDLVSLLVKLVKYNNAPLIGIYVSADVKDSYSNIIYLTQPGFGLPGRLYYLTENLAHMREAYVTFARSAAELFGADPAQAEDDMEDMMKLETEIANISMASEELRDPDPLYNKMTIAQLTQNITEPISGENIQFKWIDYISGVMGLENVNISINDSEPVVVRTVPYYEKLFGVLNSYTTRTIANYAVWIIIKNRASNLPSMFRDLVTKYNEVIYGTTSSTARWRQCEDYTVDNFGQAVGYMFVKETFDESAKSVALTMIENVRTSFNEILDELDWMDEDTKVVARDKAAAITEYIGYPDAILDLEVLDGIYQNSTVSRSEYFNNVLNNLILSSSGSFRILRDTNIKYQTIWRTPPSTVNAYYNRIENSIMFPAGILQPPFYDKYQPQSMNYGGIGMVIGHEITHGFDDNGRRYDKNGNLVQWWEETIVNNFKKKAQCIVDQYSGFTVPEAPELNVNGINTQGENIADNGGLKQSFRAYRKWINQRGKEEPSLPGLNVTNDQLFFINFAQVWCNNMRQEAAVSAINTGVHSPGQFRVIGTLQNSEDFARTFKCPSTSNMNPSDKCSVW